MAYDVTGYRDDWLTQFHNNTVYPTAPSLSISESILPHDFVGAQPNYIGSLTQHGQYCLRSNITGVSSQTMARYFSAQQASDDDAAIDMQGAVILDTQVNGSYAGICVKCANTGHAEGTVVCPVQTSLSDGDNVVVSDGTTSITFWVDKTGTYVPGGGYDATNIRWLVQSLTTAVEVADELRDISQTALGAGTYDVTTDNPGDATVRFTNRWMDTGSASGYVTNEPITFTGPFTVTGMSGGGNYWTSYRGYAMWVQPETNSIYMGSHQSAMASSNPALNNTATDIALKQWIGLRMTAHRVGNSMRLKGYYMAGQDKVDNMYTDPDWTQIFDIFHIDGNNTMYQGSSIVGQTLGLWNTLTPSYTGKFGFLVWTGGSSLPLAHFAAMRAIRGSVL